MGCQTEREIDLPPDPLSPHLYVSLSEDGTVTLDSSAADPEGGELDYMASKPHHGTVTGVGPRFTYTPTVNYAGTDTFTITVSDGKNAVSVPVDITVTDVNDAPVASDRRAMADENTPVSLLLPATDIDSELLTYAVVVPPAHGALSGTPPALLYTPSANFVGADSFSFHASDGSLISNVGTVTISVVHVVSCGDGALEGSEQCDDGNQDDTDACPNSCVPARCGDGSVWAGREACDDGNDIDDDDCHNDCSLPAGGGT